MGTQAENEIRWESLLGCSLLDGVVVDMKGIVWKYYPDITDPDLKDEMGRYGCAVANPDPDFWENRFPMWAICGPWVRASLEPGDVIFFSPALRRSRKANFPDYVCAGYLTVASLLQDNESLMAHPEVSARYKNNYKRDLQAHLADDTPRTARLRSRNIVIGDPDQSRWFGRHGPELGMALSGVRIRDLDIYSRRVRNLSGEEAERLRTNLNDRSVK